MRILQEDTIGLVVDIQERLFPVMAGKEELLKNCRILIEGLQVLKVPVLFTQQYTRGLGETIPEIKEIAEKFDFIEKRAFSCWDEPVFKEKLKTTGKQNIVICGIESHVCVLQTAVDLREAGFNPVVVMDCITSRELKSREIATLRYLSEGIRMATCESILFELTRTSESPEFREISRHVK